MIYIYIYHINITIRSYTPLLPEHCRNELRSFAANSIRAPQTALSEAPQAINMAKARSAGLPKCL